MPNPDKIGEFDVFYYQIQVPLSTGVDFGVAQETDPVLGLAYNATGGTPLEQGWKELCLVNLDNTDSYEEIMFNDRCSPDIETVAPGRRSFSLSFELNQLRISDDEVYGWYTAVDGRQMFSVMALTSEATDTKTYGFVGNFIITSADQTQPQSGANTDSYTMRPAARAVSTTPIVRRIYGSDVFPGP